MLVLSRRNNESIVIDGEIVVTVLGVDRGGQVRLGIEAPDHVRILRRELLDQVRAANREALADAAACANLSRWGRGDRDGSGSA